MADIPDSFYEQDVGTSTSPVDDGSDSDSTDTDDNTTSTEVGTIADEVNQDSGGSDDTDPSSSNDSSSVEVGRIDDQVNQDNTDSDSSTDSDSGSQTPQGAPPDPSSGPSPEESDMPSTPDVESDTTDTDTPQTGPGGIPVGPTVGNEGTSSDEQTSTEPTTEPDTETETGSGPPSPTTDTDSTQTDTESDPERATIPAPSSDSAGIVGRFTTEENAQDYIPEIREGTAEDRQVFTTERQDEILVLSAEDQGAAQNLLETNTELNVVNQTPGLDDRGDVAVSDGQVEVTESGQESLEQFQEQQTTQAIDEQFADVDISRDDLVDTGGQLELDLQTQRQVVAAQQGVDTDQVTFTGDGFRVEGATQQRTNPLQGATNAITGAAPASPVFTPAPSEETDQDSDTPEGMVEPNADVGSIDSGDLEFETDEELPDNVRSGPTPGSQNQGQTTVAPTETQVQLSSDQEGASINQDQGVQNTISRFTTGGLLAEEGDSGTLITDFTGVSEQDLSGLSQRYTEASQFVGGQVGGAVDTVVRPITGEEGETTAGAFVEGGTESVGQIGNVPAFAQAGETGIEIGEESLTQAGKVVNPTDEADVSGEEVVGATTTVANTARAGISSQIRNNPAGFAGQITGGALAGYASGAAISSGVRRLRGRLATRNVNAQGSVDFTEIERPDVRSGQSRLTRFSERSVPGGKRSINPDDFPVQAADEPETELRRLAEEFATKDLEEELDTGPDEVTLFSARSGMKSDSFEPRSGRPYDPDAAFFAGSVSRNFLDVGDSAASSSLRPRFPRPVKAARSLYTAARSDETPTIVATAGRLSTLPDDVRSRGEITRFLQERRNTDEFFVRQGDNQSGEAEAVVSARGADKDNPDPGAGIVESGETTEFVRAGEPFVTKVDGEQVPIQLFRQRDSDTDVDTDTPDTTGRRDTDTETDGDSFSDTDTDAETVTESELADLTSSRYSPGRDGTPFTPPVGSSSGPSDDTTSPANTPVDSSQQSDTDSQPVGSSPTGIFGSLTGSTPPSDPESPTSSFSGGGPTSSLFGGGPSSTFSLLSPTGSPPESTPTSPTESDPPGSPTGSPPGSPTQSPPGSPTGTPPTDTPTNPPRSPDIDLGLDEDEDDEMLGFGSVAQGTLTDFRNPLTGGVIETEDIDE